MKQAVIDPASGLVENVILADPGFEIPGRLLVPSDTAGPGDTYDAETGTFTGPPEPDPPTLEEMRAQALQHLAARRYRAETGGIEVQGVPVATDRQSQALVTGAALAASLDAEYSVKWKTAAGVFVTLDADALLGLAQAVRAHVQACFDHEADLAELIAQAGDEAALEAIDLDAGWP